MTEFPNTILLDIRATEEEHKLLHVVDALGHIRSMIDCAGYAADSPSACSEVGSAISITLQRAVDDLQAVIDALDEIRPQAEQGEEGERQAA